LAETTHSNPVAALTGVHHIGISVASLEAALVFWETFLGRPARWTTTLDRPYLSRVVGYPSVSIRAAFVDLPGGGVVELLDYHRTGDRIANSEATANPGNVHLCLAVTDAEGVWRRALACGARSVSGDGPVEIDAGPNVGSKSGYLRIHDGVTLELFQPARSEDQAQ
jgi:catechol 2,3-dioxygenase-like lactoylglutathione lyase family enzyme